MSDRVTITGFERLRCMDEDDRVCACGERVSIRWCNYDPIVACKHCGRRYEVLRDGEEALTALPAFRDLVEIPRKKQVAP